MSNQVSYGTFRFLKNFDMFGANVSFFSIEGQNDVRTPFGALISIVIMCLTTSFALLKLQFMLLRKRPDVFTIT